jgi:NADH-quinone oxidoreductase subunit M
MIVLLLILIPLLGGLISFFIKEERLAKGWALLVSVATLAVSLFSLITKSTGQLYFSTSWMGSLGSSFTIQLDGMSQLLCLLTSVAYPLIFTATWRTSYKNARNFFALMLLTQAGLMGVFTAMDALLFYFFWELALIPVYFLCSQWGGDRRIQVTFKFFIYTFSASVIMLIGLFSNTRPFFRYPIIL